MWPLWSLKVLLVENDDSTRHVVCALLRKCGYEVVAVENGLEAWKNLEDLTDQIDLILTEVVMPCLSGIDLLCKIMSHKICKNIPVIMMSSHDSMSVVFKCLSKGAVYFLVKPMRKNELRNLWQHVWRKHHSSSWTKRSGVLESPKPISPWEQLADPPNSTCSQVILSRPEAFGNSWVPTTTTRECGKQDDELYHVVMGKDLELGVPRIPSLQVEDPTEKELNNIASINKEKHSEMSSKEDYEQQEKQLDLNSKNPNGDLRNLATDQMGVVTNSIDSTIRDVVFDITNGCFNVSSIKETVIYENNEIPSLELSLKRQRDTGDSETGLHERNVLRHSDEHSAFSRYTSASTANKVPTRNVGSNSLLDNSSEAAKTESVQNFQSNPKGTPLSQQSNDSSNSGVGLTINSAYTEQMVSSDKPTPESTVKTLHSSSQQVQNGHKLPQPKMLGKADANIAKTILAQVRGMKQQVQVQYHHHLQHVHYMLQQQLANQDDSLLKTMAMAAPLYGSANGLSAPSEGDTGNHGLNGRTSGSNHGSNGQNGSSLVLDARGTTVESDDGLAAKSGASGGIGHASRSGVEKNRSTQRETALNKFRQKRKKRDAL